jgi:hypothetical protein
LISRTVSDDDAYCGDIDDCSVRAFAVKPAPSARRHAALGLTARRGRANPATVPLMHSTAMAPVINQRTLLSDNVRQVECWFSQMIFIAAVVIGTAFPASTHKSRTLIDVRLATSGPKRKVPNRRFVP